MVSPGRPARHHDSYDECLTFERDSAAMHEYIGGEIMAIAGASASSRLAW